MTFLARLTNARMAQAFVDYLHVINVHAHVQASSEQTEINEQSVDVFVDEGSKENALTIASDELQLFLSNPNDAKYLEASWQVNNTETGLSYQSTSNNLIHFLLHGGWVTQSVFWICVGVFIWMSTTHVVTVLNAIGFFKSFTSAEIVELWRWVTPAFIHFSAMHIVFNLLWWWKVGGDIEQSLSSTHLLALTLTSAAVSNTAQFIASNNNFGGLSGVVYAVIGFVWLTGRLNPDGPLRLANALMGFMLFWLVLGFMDLLWVNMANFAHLFGLLTGLLFAKLYSKDSKTE